jgi:CheY-like chemotaxis protein
MQKLTNVVRRQTRALSRMVDDLLDVSRVTLGKIQLATEPIAVAELVTRVGDAVRETMKNCGLAFEVVIDGGPVWVQGDATRLEQVLTNLLANAAKFTPAGGTVSIRAGREDDEAVIRVRDTGIGMPATLVPRIFELFVQGDTSLDRSKSGLGIGLALSRQVIGLHGGTISAASEGPGHGSEFTVRLPLTTERTRSAGPPETEQPMGRPMRVLVVDDQRDVADAVAMLISTFGHDARAVYDGATALDVSRSTLPDIMFVDLGMPGMTGFDLAHQVRSDPELSGVRLVALTGYGREEDRVRVHEAGFNLHLMKPVADAALQAALSSLART